MTKIAAALALVAALAAAASAETYTLTPSDGSGAGFTVTADRAPVITGQGVPAFPPGTQLRIDARGSRAFEVFVVGPASLDDGCARHHWTAALTQAGGYKLQFGRKTGMSPMSQVDFIISDDPGRLAEVTPYRYGWDEDSADGDR